MLTNCSGGPVLTKIRFASVMMLVVVCLAAAQRPQPAPTNAIKIPIETYVLPNGLTVILSTDHSTPTVAVAAWYHVGSKNETPGRTGFAHLFEHVMFTGSGHVPYGLHDKLTEGVGGSNNGTTSSDGPSTSRIFRVTTSNRPSGWNQTGWAIYSTRWISRSSMHNETS